MAWLNARPDQSLVSSTLVEVEVPRAVRRSAPDALAGIPAVLGRLYRLDIDATVWATAGAYTDEHLRSLDAIHLATAQRLAGEPGAQLDAFVAYDERLLRAASAVWATAGAHREPGG